MALRAGRPPSSDAWPRLSVLDLGRSVRYASAKGVALLSAHCIVRLVEQESASCTRSVLPDGSDAVCVALPRERQRGPREQ